MTTTTLKQDNEIGENMQYALLAAGSVVHQNGVPARLITDAIVAIAHGNMAQTVGYHLAAVPTPQAADLERISDHE